MNNHQEIKYYISNLRQYLKKNSINENTAKQIEFILLNQFRFISNLTFKKKIHSFSRVTINKKGK